ncbi:putative transcription factor/ chromatin remodeling BED-type(Zn) family [Helianthus annuus]|nr:putative transcription factor/ chromatin remodeling BED-type(Zn) family [Helianthus annuus]
MVIMWSMSISLMMMMTWVRLRQMMLWIWNRLVITTKKRGRKQSIVWDHFNKPTSVPPEDARTTCKHYKKSYVYEPSRNGTSTLLTHLKRLCKFNPLKCQKDEKQKTLSFQGNGSGARLMCGRFTKELGKLAIAKMIFIDELSFRFVEKERFRYFCSLIRPELELPSRTTIAREIISLYVDEKKKLKELLQKSSHAVCLTTDAWTTCQNIDYMVLTVHYIDQDWNLQKRILNFEVISNHRGDTIGKMI